MGSCRLFARFPAGVTIQRRCIAQGLAGGYAFFHRQGSFLLDPLPPTQKRNP